MGSNKQKEKEKESMDILYSSSDSYAFLTGISILSLLENNKSCDRIHIYIMDNHISAENKDKLVEVVNNYGRQISFVPMPDIEAMTGRNINTGRWNISTFGRLFMASVLPGNVHKVLNIDCDTIIVDSLTELWKTDISGKVFGGISECMNDRYRRNIGKSSGEGYFNGGIVYMNCDEVRKREIENQFVEFIAKYGDSLAYLDQDVLNGVIDEDDKLMLPLKYDVLSIYYYTTYNELLKIRRSKDFYSANEYENAKKNPTIVHFTTCFLDGLRPWIIGNQHPYRDTFLQYKRMSPWADLPLLEDNRRFKQKMSVELLKKMPRFLLCEISSVLHGVVIPERNYRRMKKMEGKVR